MPGYTMEFRFIFLYFQNIDYQIFVIYLIVIYFIVYIL